MSTAYSRYFSALADYNAGNPIDDRDFDGEFDAMTTALNRKVLCAASAPSSPIEGQTWIDTTNKVVKVYLNSAWTSVGIMITGDFVSSSSSTARPGWTDVTSTYDGKFMRVSTGTALATGGADTHTHEVGTFASQDHAHTAPAHTHAVSGNSATETLSGSGSANAISYDGGGAFAVQHYHAISFTSGSGGESATTSNGAQAITGTSAAGDNVPAYFNVKLWQMD